MMMYNLHTCMSCHVMSGHVRSGHVMSGHVMSGQVMSCHVMSCTYVCMQSEHSLPLVPLDQHCYQVDPTLWPSEGEVQPGDHSTTAAALRHAAAGHGRWLSGTAQYSSQLQAHPHWQAQYWVGHICLHAGNWPAGKSMWVGW